MAKFLSEDLELDDYINNIKKSIEKNKENKMNNESLNTQKSEKIEKNTENNDKKFQNELFGDGLPDYYKIIGVSQSDSHEIIVKKCGQRMAEYHADKIKSKLMKYPPEERKKQQKRYEAQFELVREAKEYLANPEKRKYYDLQRKNIESGSFYKSKNSFEEFIKAQESEINENNKTVAISTFKTKSNEMDKKHGIKRSSDDKYGKDNYHMDKAEFSRRYEDMSTLREQQDADCLPKNIFQHSSFDIKEFNKHWELKQKIKDKKKNKTTDDRSIIQWEGVSAANDFGANGGNFASLDGGDDAYEGIYNKTNENDYIFAKTLDSDEESISSLGSDMSDIDISYVDGFDKNKDSTMKSYQDKLKEREKDEVLFDKRTVTDVSWKDVTQNPFNISHQMGEIVGEEIGNKKMTQKDKKVTLDAYKSLMYERDNDFEKNTKKQNKR
jgi:hypothetical protein